MAARVDDFLTMTKSSNVERESFSRKREKGDAPR
jgi:hypothetical protein